MNTIYLKSVFLSLSLSFIIVNKHQMCRWIKTTKKTFCIPKTYHILNVISQHQKHYNFYVHMCLNVHDEHVEEHMKKTKQKHEKRQRIKCKCSKCCCYMLTSSFFLLFEWEKKIGMRLCMFALSQHISHYLNVIPCCFYFSVLFYSIVCSIAVRCCCHRCVLNEFKKPNLKERRQTGDDKWTYNRRKKGKKLKKCRLADIIWKKRSLKMYNNYAIH